MFLKKYSLTIVGTQGDTIFFLMAWNTKSMKKTLRMADALSNLHFLLCYLKWMTLLSQMRTWNMDDLFPNL